jgi:hypothetical protein
VRRSLPCRHSNSSLALTCLAALLLTSRDVRAYCRTTTSKAPSGYNPAVSGCWNDGVPLSWHAERVPYAVSRAASSQVPLSAATRIADLAFSAWNKALCDGKPLGITAYDDGPADVTDAGEGDALAAWAQCTDSNSCNPSAHDVIVFDDAAWPYNDPANTLALTTVTYGVDDGQIFQAYTEVNTAEQTITTDEPPPVDGSAYDLQAILTHEAGHFLGLAHATSTTSIMYAYYHPGAIELTPDDVDGICAAYPTGSGKSAANCSCDAIGARSGSAAAVAALSLAVASLTRLRRRGRRP